MKLLGLVMIVRNEAQGIVATLESVKPLIDHWTILDTGSTDGTQDLIRKTLEGVPGQLYEEPFVDFSTSRNRALDLHGEATQWALMLSGDDLLVFKGDHDPQAFRGALLGGLATSIGGTQAFSIERRLGSSRFMQTLVTRTGRDWRYQGRTHEAISNNGQGATETLPGVYVMRTRDGTPEEKRARWEQDRQILSEDVANDRTNARAVFYLAQTYECLGRHYTALSWYEHRMTMGGWKDELYEATFRSARCLDKAGLLWSYIQARYLEAFSLCLDRAEPLYAIAQHYYAERNYALTYLFARSAAQMPYPKTPLFVDAEVYEWKAADLVAISAYYLGLHDIGKAAAEKVVKALPGDERALKNLSFYKSR